MPKLHPGGSLARRRRLPLVIVEGPTPALWTFVALNMGVWVLWQLAWILGGPIERLMTTHFLVSVGHAWSAPWTLLTSAISQADLPHLAFNMIALIMFGRDLERIVGSTGFVHLYVMGGVVSSLGHVLYGVVTGDATPALGASGAVMAVLIVSTFLFPTRLLLFFFLVPMPQAVAVTLFVISDLLGLFGGLGGIAHGAHLGGALYGWIYARRHLHDYVDERLRRFGIVGRRRIR